MRQCYNAHVTHEVSATRQDLANLMRTVEDLATQMKLVQDLATQMKGNQVPPDPDVDKEVETSILDESSMVHEDYSLMKSKGLILQFHKLSL